MMQILTRNCPPRTNLLRNPTIKIQWKENVADAIYIKDVIPELGLLKLATMLWEGVARNPLALSHNVIALAVAQWWWHTTSIARLLRVASSQSWV